MERQTHPSEHAKERLVDELRESVGDEAVDRADIDVDRAVAESGRAKTPESSRSRLMFVVFGALGIVVAGVVALVLQSWVVLVALLALHAVATAIVVATTLKTTENVEKPAPTTVAMLEEEGVDDPEGALNRLVDQAAEADEHGRAAEVARERRSVTPQEHKEADSR
jgi:Flp pilus assembly protein TadB